MPSPAPAAGRACGKADLAISELKFAGYAAGTAYYDGSATAGTGACQLPATTSALLLDASGTRMATKGQGAAGAVAVGKGESLVVTIAVSPPCGLPGEPRKAQIALLGGAVLTVPIAADGQPYGHPCATPTAAVTIAAATAAASASPAPQIAAAISAAGPATPGASFSYTVTLTNTSSTLWSFSPCPAYDEGIKAGSGYSESHLLNCTAATPIAPGASETFDMSLAVPADAVAGQSLLTWSLEGADSGANAAITIQ